ncbi:MAG: hypothetical protein SF070_04305, partial [Gemmatimonadota bacterium]|nr:hypothetical protein [Gemmatimonadota bacterium]
AAFRPRSLPAAGAFDVVEHIADDATFLRRLHGQLVPGGRFYCTVPACPALWSAEDAQAGHYRRYSRAGLAAVLRQAGFTVEYLTGFFLWLTLPVGLFRALPTRLHLVNPASAGGAAAMQADHRLPALLAGVAARCHAWELGCLQARRPIPFGTSLLCVARANVS